MISCHGRNVQLNPQPVEKEKKDKYKQRIFKVYRGTHTTFRNHFGQLYMIIDMHYSDHAGCIENVMVEIQTELVQGPQQQLHS